MFRFLFYLILFSSFLFPADQFKKLSLEERAKYKMKIEEVYQNIRTDGKSSKLPDFQFFLKEAEKDVKFSRALEIYFNFNITEEALQAELERIVTNTKQPETLKEIFEVLENDPETIVEVFVRSVLARRLLENYYYNDFKLNKDFREGIEKELKNVKYAKDLKYLSGNYLETLVKLVDKKGGPPVDSTVKYSRTEYENFLKGLIKKFQVNGSEGLDEKILQIGSISRIIEDREGIRVIGILDRGRDYIKICTSFWQKKRFHKWWEEIEKEIPSNLSFKKASFSMPQLRNGSCKDDSWYKIAGPPDERYNCATLTFGSRMAIWGGIDEELVPLNTGFIYDATSDSWSEMSTTNAPSARKEFSFTTAISSLIVWGGVDIDGNYLNTGAIYNLFNDTWTPMNNTGDVPSGRKNATLLFAPIAGYVLFGGENASGKLNDLYYYSTFWVKSTAPDPPSPRSGATAVVHSDNNRILVWGGRGTSNQPLRDGKIHSLQLGSWQTIPDPPAGNERYEHKMIYYDGKVYIWGGMGSSGPLNTGLIFDYSNNSWSSMSTSPLGPRYGHSAVLAGSTIIIWGGQGSLIVYGNGAKYDISGNSWTTIATGPTPRAFHSAGYTDTYMLIWGGTNGNDIFGSGARYNISNNSWTSMYDGGAPTPRYDYGAIWTGTEVIIFGGYYLGTAYNSGKKYIPSTDTWASIADATILEERSLPAFYYWQTEGKAILWGGVDANGANLGDGAFYDISLDSWQLMNDTDPDYPTPRSYFASAWDPLGEKMYIWGGYIDDDPYYANTGAIYDASTDSWSTITTTNAPEERAMATGIWTGSKFIVWGGEDVNWETLNTGGVYDPLTDSWTQTDTTDPDTPSERAYHMAEFIDGGMLIWGGDNYSESLNDGAIYYPSSNSWTALPESSLDPRACSGFKYNGRDLFIWGGNDTNAEPSWLYFKDGERYYPAENSFSPVSTVGSPKKRSNVIALWTGKYFFIWGGVALSAYPTSGALYCSCLTAPPHSSSPSPSNGGIACYSSSINLSCTNEEANLFDIYIDSNLECQNVSSCSCSKSLSLGSHNWYVVSKNHCGTASGTPPTWTLDVIDKPSSVSNPDPANGSAKCSSQPVVATWTASTYATQYDVYLNSSLVTSCQNITQTSCNFGSLSGGGYTWYVVAKNICGTQQGPTWSFSIDTSVPSAPTNPNPANGSSVCPDPDLSWSASTGVRTYDVYYDTNLICQNITSTTCDPGTISSGSHNWYVVAKNGCGNTPSSTWSFSIKQAPGDATNPNPANGAEICDRNPALSWTAAPNALTYDVYVDSEKKCSDITGTSCIPGTLSIGAHTWYVVAKNGCPTQDNQSDIWTLYIDEASPGEATNIYPPDGAYVCPNPTLDWDPAPNARRYDVYLNDTKICNNTSNTYCNTTVSSGSHNWYIISKNYCGATRTPAEPNKFYFSILATPSQPTVQDIDVCQLNGVQISWSSVSGATGYDLRIDGTTIIYNVTSPYTYEPGNSNSHSYQIRAKNTYCTTVWSTSASGTDENQTPSTPSITSIEDVDTCAQSGIKVYYNSGSPATRHDLYRNGVKVVENYTSGAVYNPGSTTNYTYHIKAVNGTCTKDSSTQDFSDANNTPTPTISGANQNTCPDEFVLLSTQSGMSNYQWYRNGEIITGANSYQYTATLSGIYTVYYKNSYGCGNTSSGHSVTIVACYGPEPVADGKLYGNAAKFKKASDFGTTGKIDVTFDSTTCSNDHIAILYGNLIGTNSFDGYDGCALANGGNTGSTNFTSTGQDNVWYNIIWVSNTYRAGHPGYYFQNGSDGQRNWSAIGLCSITSELQNDWSCNGIPGNP